MSRAGVVAVVLLVLLAGCSAVPGMPTGSDSDPIDTETPVNNPTAGTLTSTSTPPPASSTTPTSSTTDTPLPTDSDSLSFSEEERLGTDPSDSDTDGDGIKDGKEVNKWGTDPTDADTDGDGIRDVKETFQETNATDADTDDDGLEDGREVELGTDPVVADTDGDGISDGEEVRRDLNPTNTDSDGDGLSDSEDPSPLTYNDGDGLSPEREEELGTDPKKADTDDDNLRDDRELEIGTDPLDPDTDRDALLDGDEYHGNESGVSLKNADPLHYDIYVQEVVTPNGEELPENRKEWMAEQFSEFNVSNLDGESGVHLHWAETTTTERSTNQRNFNPGTFRTDKTDPYIVLVQDGDANSQTHGTSEMEVAWTDDDGSYSRQAWVDGHEILHIVQADVIFQDGCVNRVHACESWLSYDFESTNLPQKVVDDVEERGLWNADDGPW